MEFDKQYGIYLKAVNEELAQLADYKNTSQQHVFDAMRYSLLGGGKRIRPVFLVAVCDMLGGNVKDAVKVGAALECIHTYSLIHDDLPCMDNDDLRRGRPTCHKVFEENIALLAGDALLNYAFELLSDTQRYENLSAGTLVRLIRAISTASGACGMIGGQVIDLENEGRADMPLALLYELHRNKTGALIRTAAECGCICAGLDGEDARYRTLIAFAEDLGLAFQIKDDILDVEGDEVALGKPIGSDAQSGKNTFVTLMGMERAKEELEKLTIHAKNCVKILPNSEFLLAFADYLLYRNI